MDLLTDPVALLFRPFDSVVYLQFGDDTEIVADLCTPIYDSIKERNENQTHQVE